MSGGALLMKGSIILITVFFYIFVMSISIFVTVIFITPKLSGQVALFSIVMAMIPPSILTIFLLKRIIRSRFVIRLGS